MTYFLGKVSRGLVHLDSTTVSQFQAPRFDPMLDVLCNQAKCCKEPANMLNGQYRALCKAVKEKIV